MNTLDRKTAAHLRAQSKRIEWHDERRGIRRGARRRMHQRDMAQQLFDTVLVGGLALCVGILWGISITN